MELEVIINSSPNQKNIPDYPTRPGGFSAEFFRTIKKDLIPILFKLFYKIETGGTLSNLFDEATITLIPKPHKDSTKKNFRPISLMNIDAKNTQ